jgi:hypothetical protein
MTHQEQTNIGILARRLRYLEGQLDTWDYGRSEPVYVCAEITALTWALDLLQRRLGERHERFSAAHRSGAGRSNRTGGNSSMTAEQ